MKAPAMKIEQTISTWIASLDLPRSRKLVPLQLFLLLCFNLLLAPVVQAATGGELNRGQAYAIALLGLVTFGLAIYLCVVIVQPERF